MSRPGVLGPLGQTTAGNVVSRVTGLLRVLAVGAALGTTFLGNTYQTANLVSNLLFELLAAGVLSSVLVPPFVALLDAGRRDEAERVAGAVLGVALAGLGVVTVLGLVGRTWIMQALTVAVPDPAVRAAEVRLGAVLLWLFVPQVLCYGLGAVATAVLYGSRRFAAAAFAPVANNVLVIATMVAFRAMQGGGGRPGLSPPGSQQLVLAAGTTAGVLAMALVPVLALRRAGFRLRPRWVPSHPGLRALARAGAWGAAFLALSQVLIATTLVLANRVEGGVIAYHIAFTVFLLPYAVLAHPVLTTVYPRLAADAHAGRWPAFAALLGDGARSLAFLVLPASALLVALAGPGLRLARLGALDAGGAALVGRVLAAYSVGLLGYAGFQLLTRASYAAGDTRTPALVNAGVVAGGSGLMVVLYALATGSGRVVVVGVAHSAAMLAGAGVLAGLVRRRVGHPLVLGTTLARSAAGAVAAGGAAWLVAGAVPHGSRAGAALAVALGGAAGVGAYVASQWALRAPELAALRAGPLRRSPPAGVPEAVG